MENLPFQKSFQTEVLKGLVQDKKFLRESLGLLKPEFFENHLLSLACQSIYEVYAKTKSLAPKPLLLQMMSDRLSKEVHPKSKEQTKDLVLKPIQRILNRMYEPVNGSQTYVQSESLKFCRVQSMKRSLLEVFEDLEREQDPEKAQAQLNQKLRVLHHLEMGGSNFFKNIEHLPSQIYKDKSKCSTTGYATLDRWMEGGMDPGTETVFMAPPKFGKSMILVNIGFANLLRGKTVIHFTLEISDKKIEVRYAKRISRISNLEKLPRKMIRRVKRFQTLHKGKLYVKQYPTKMATVETLRSYVYHLQNKEDVKPDLIIVDYGDLLRSHLYRDKTGDSERFIQGDVYEGLRAMAGEFDCPIVTASQCNRGAASKPIIRMEDIAEAYAKVQVADHIVALCGTDEERRENRMRLFFAGSREGNTGGVVRVRFNWTRALLKEVEYDDKKEAE